jgi:zinc transport system substrate-binding protein
MNRFVTCALLLLAPALAVAAPAKLRVGVTLHPYYSWTASVVAGTNVEVVPVLPGEIDAGNYQPSPQDIAKLQGLDALVINGLGHDDFITGMVKASGNTKLLIIRPNDATPTVKFHNGEAVNSHTFISFTNAIQQSYAIARALGTLRPELAATFEKNAQAYARRLRTIKAGAANKLVNPKVTRVVTVHDGYSYLLQEFGIDLAGVVQPSHGLTPSASELSEMIALMKKDKITVVLSEESFPPALLHTLQEATGAHVYLISHGAAGPYAADEFEKVMQKNADTLVQALTRG